MKVRGPVKTVLGMVVPTKYRQLSDLGLTTFRATYNPHHDPRLNYLDATVNSSSGALYEITRKRVLNRPRNCLWWSVHMYLDSAPKPTMRRWCVRRTKTAFVQALRDRGLDKDGRVLEQSSDPHLHRTSLWGSLKLQVRSITLTAPFTAVQEDARTLVNALLAGK